MKKKSLRDYLLGPLLSGVLIGTSYIPFPPWAVFFCYVPLWFFALKQEKLKPLITGGWICQFVVTLIGFNWVAFALQEMGFPFWPHTFFLFLFFASIANLHIPLSLFLYFIFRKILSSCWQFPVFWSSTARKTRVEETNRSSIGVGCRFFPGRLSCIIFLPLYLALCTEYYPMIFEWHLGYTLFYAKLPISQTAEIWGFKFLNTLILLFNLIFLYIFMQYLQLKKSTLYSLVLLALVFGALNFYGLYLKNRLPEPDQTIQVLMVQPNIKNKIQEDEKYNNYILSQVLRETSKHFLTTEPVVGLQNNTAFTEKTHTLLPNQKINFILWPEGAYPYGIDVSKVKKEQDPVQKRISIFNVPLIISAKGVNTLGNLIDYSTDNTKDKSADNSSSVVYTNSVFVFHKDGRLVESPYNKTLLLPFGEYTPGANWFPFIDKWLFGESRFYSPGTGENKIVRLDKYNLGFQICYEGLFDGFSREIVKKGADILVNVSNDAWFGNWQEPYQHLYMTLSRAIEVRRSLIRGTNSGLSAVVSAKGDIFISETLGKNWSQIKEVSVYSQDKKPSSVFISWGYYINPVFLWVCLILTIFLVSKELLCPLIKIK